MDTCFGKNARKIKRVSTQYLEKENKKITAERK